MSSGRRGGIPGPESRTGLVRPAMTEAEFERRLGGPGSPREPLPTDGWANTAPDATEATESQPGALESETAPRPSTSRSAAPARAARAKPSKPRRVQRMFAVEEELDKKLWLYAIHVGKDRSDVVNDLLRPLVGSMVLYDSRERRSGRSVEVEAEA